MLVVQDCNGHNQLINFALTAYEREQSLDTILDMFIANNDTNKTKVVMIDKDLTEYKSIKAKLPNVSILLFHFHVIKIFKKEFKNESYDLLLKLLESKTIDEFKKYEEYENMLFF